MGQQHYPTGQKRICTRDKPIGANKKPVTVTGGADTALARNPAQQPVGKSRIFPTSPSLPNPQFVTVPQLTTPFNPMHPPKVEDRGIEPETANPYPTTGCIESEKCGGTESGTLADKTDVVDLARRLLNLSEAARRMLLTIFEWRDKTND